MKKQLLLLLAISIASVSYSQNVYVKPAFGYSFFGQDYSLVDEISIVEQTEDEYIVTRANYSLGEGTRPSISVGGQIFDYLYAEIELAFFKGKEFTYEKHSRVGSFKRTASYTYHTNQFQITPLLIIKPESEFISPFFAAGPMFSIGNIHHQEKIISNASESNKEMVFKSAMNIGFNTAFGVDIKLSEYASVCVEGYFNLLSYYPEKAEITALTNGEKDLLSQLSDEEKIIDYKEHVIYKYNQGSADDLKVKLPMNYALNSFGLRISAKIGI